MSVIQRKPFIESVIESLTAELKSDLLDLVNGSDKTPDFRSLVNESALITGSDKNKVQYVTLETWAKLYTGYLIYNNSYCVLIAFSSNTQALVMLDINATNRTYRVVKEFLDINELRRELGGGGGGSSGDSPRLFNYAIDGIPSDVVEDLKHGDFIAGDDSLFFVVSTAPNAKFFASINYGDDYDGRIFFAKYKKNNGVWSFDDTYGPDRDGTAKNKTRTLIPVGSKFIDSIEELDENTLESLISPGDLLIEDETQTCWVSCGFKTDQEDNEYHYFYNYDVESKKVVSVRYAWDENEDTWVFDTSYGTDGYLTISLSGSHAYRIFVYQQDIGNCYCLFWCEGDQLTDQEVLKAIYDYGFKTSDYILGCERPALSASSNRINYCLGIYVELIGSTYTIKVLPKYFQFAINGSNIEITSGGSTSYTAGTVTITQIV